MMRQLRTALVAGLIAALTLTGCASIPRTGPVNAGAAVQAETDPDIIYVPRAPENDASPEQILGGFIDAASSPANNYAIAREFLSGPIAAEWQPDARTVVDESERRVVSMHSDTKGSLSVRAKATVDATGVYRLTATESSSLSLDFTFAKVDGQWRITSAPDGVVIDGPKFPDVFKAYPLRFFDPSWKTLVSDLRWFPARSSTATRVVKALLDGPSPVLVGAVSTAFPEGVRLLSESVPVTDNIAEIDLTSETEALDPTTLTRINTQLTESLNTVNLVDSVRFSVNGIIQDSATASVRTPRTDTRALTLTDGAFGYLSTGVGVDRLPGLSAAMEELRATGATMSSDGSLIAALSPRGLSAVRISGVTRLDARPGLVIPTIDSAGNIWSVPGRQPSSLRVYSSTGEYSLVTTSWPSAERIASLAISRDGTRVLAYVEGDDGPELLVAGIVRDGNDSPVRLTEPESIASAPGKPVSATWMDDGTVASLGVDEDGVGTVVRTTIGGLHSEFKATMPNATALVSGSSASQLRVLNASGDLFVWRSTSWQRVATKTTMIATQLGSFD